MKLPLYYQIATIIAKPCYRLLLSFGSAQRDHVGVVTQAQEFAMRFARDFPVKNNKSKSTRFCMWLHITSVVEINKVTPIVERFLAEGYEIVITTTSHTSFERTQQLFLDTVHIRFVPVDAPKEITKFLDYYQPRLALFTCIKHCAAFLYHLHKRRVCSVLLDAYVDEKSHRLYQRFAQVSTSMMHNISHVICQDETSIQRLQSLGVHHNKIHLCPALHFAVDIADQEKQQEPIVKNSMQIHGRNVIFAVHTHDHDEAMLLAVFTTLKQMYPDLILVLSPHENKRFEQVASIIESQGYTAYRSSVEDIVTADTQVYLVDTLTELALWHTLADMVVVGGSFTPKNITEYNPLQAMVYTKPVIIGQYMDAYQAVIDDLVTHNAIEVVADHQELYDLLFLWLDNMSLAQRIADNGADLIQANQHAVTTQYELIQSFIHSHIQSLDTNL